MPKAFKYDILKLIDGVRDRPCLWDKKIENYKDRVERRNAWEEIFNILDDTYEQMSLEEKRLMGELILNKWTNIRDTFVKTLKTKMGKPKKKYLYYQELKFLTKDIPEKERPEEYSNEEVTVNYTVDDNEQSTSTGISPVKKRSKKPDHSTPMKKSKKQNTDDISSVKKRDDNSEIFESSINYDEENDHIDFVEVDEGDPRIMNEDEAFFASLLPTIVKYNEDDRLEFRMEVLAIMKRLKDKRNWTYKFE